MQFPFLKRGNLGAQIREVTLSSYLPVLTLEGLVPGVDNVRHDVYLSPKFCDQARAHISQLITRHGAVEDLAVETVNPHGPVLPAYAISQVSAAAAADSLEFKRQFTGLHVNALQRAKLLGNLSVDLIARLAVIKYLRAELSAQFNTVLERCRGRLKAYENPKHINAGLGIALRDRFVNLQMRKKIVLRLAGQELFATIRTVEKETLSRMRRSLFGSADLGSYDLFINRLICTEDGRDDYLNAEHYVLLGNFDRDPDRLQTMLDIATEFFLSLEFPMEGETERAVEGWLSEPENAERLVGGGNPETGTSRGELQKALLSSWTELLERNNVMEHVIAAYEVAPLLADYSPLINPQQLKNALISKSERERVEHLLREHAKVSIDKLHQARKRVTSCGHADRMKIAGRFLRDFMRYHRDLRRLEALNSALDMVSVIANEKLRELSAINNTLYEFPLPEEQRSQEERVTGHVILKADIRDSTTVTQNLVQRGLNPASHFSLNFFEPVNKLLPRFDATKVFIEGDAIILCSFDREGEDCFSVGRSCALGREMLDIVRGYNEQLVTDQLPTLELGIGICFSDGAPLYLMDGSSRIMISRALNDSDRLSSCNRLTRKMLSSPGLFNVYAFLADDGNEDMLLRYNIGGIHLSHTAWGKLQEEISLEERVLELPMLWDRELVRLYAGLVPVRSGQFHKIIIREGYVPRVDARTFALKEWTDLRYYEICTSPLIYEYLESPQAQAAYGAD